MKVKNSQLAVGLILLTACSDVQLTPETQNSVAEITTIESGLRATYGTKNDPAPTWTLKDRMAHYKVPAVSIAVAIDGELVWAKAYGETQQGSGVIVNTETLFQAASLSKPVASLAALQLVDDGHVSLDQPANTYLSSWKIPTNDFTNTTPVTLRHLLSHRAGTTVHGFGGYKSDEKLPSLVQILNGQPPAKNDPVIVTQEPGTAYRYSGGGFTIAQLLIEDIADTSYANFVTREIFEPLQLTRSNFNYPQTDTNAAIGHTGEKSAPIPQPGLSYPELAAAGLWTTPSDLVRLGSTVATARNQEHLLLSNNIATQLVPNSADEHGLGFGLNNAGDGVAFVHNGHSPGFSARWINYADGRASVAVLTNSDSGGNLIREILSAIGHTYGWKQDGYVERETVDISPEWANAITGGYDFNPSSTTPLATITLESGKLWLDGNITGRTRLYPATKNNFFIPKGMNFTILTDENDTVKALDIEGEIQLPKLKTENQ